MLRIAVENASREKTTRITRAKVQTKLASGLSAKTVRNLLLVLQASIVNEQTGNLKLAQKFLGHSTIEMTADIYTHTSAEAEREAATALERAIYGDLFPVVPNFENGNNSAAIN